MHVTSETVWMAMRDQSPAGADGQWPRHYRTELAEGDTAWNPASTTRDIDGPAVVTYTEFADGGYTAKVTAAEAV